MWSAQQLAARRFSGGKTDLQLSRLVSDLCRNKPKLREGRAICADAAFRRGLDFLFLPAGGNDMGFPSIIAWASRRDSVSSANAESFGATVSAQEFSRDMRDMLPDAYARLAFAIEAGLPLHSGDEPVFDASRVILTAYPDLVTDAEGGICRAAPRAGDGEDKYPANQSLDMFSSWLTARPERLKAVRDQFAILCKRMGEIAGDHG